MAKGVNKVFLLGNVGKDPEFKITQGGMQSPRSVWPPPNAPKGGWSVGRQDGMAQHRLLSAHRRGRPRLRQEGHPAFHRRPHTNRSWDDKESGAKKYSTEILVNELTLLGKPGGGGEGGGGYSKSSTTPYTATTPAAAPDYADQGITDDDIPF